MQELVRSCSSGRTSVFQYRKTGLIREVTGGVFAFIEEEFPILLDYYRESSRAGLGLYKCCQVKVNCQTVEYKKYLSVNKLVRDEEKIV